MKPFTFIFHYVHKKAIYLLFYKKEKYINLKKKSWWFNILPVINKVNFIFVQKNKNCLIFAVIDSFNHFEKIYRNDPKFSDK